MDPGQAADWCNHFWGAGERGYDTVIRRVKDTSKTLDDLRAFYKERADIEAEYSKRLSKLARSPIGQNESGQIAAALEAMRQETDRIAQTHAGVATDIKGALTSGVTEFQQSQAAFRITSLAAIDKVMKNKSTQASMVERARDKYQSECSKVNSYTAQMSLVQGRDLERTAAKLEKAKQDVVANERNYRLYTKALKDTSHNWAREWKAFLDQAQDSDEARIEFVKHNCWRYIDSVAEACVADDNACQNMYDAFKYVNAAQDSSNFVHDRGTGNMVFDPPDFVNYAEGQAAAAQPQYRVAKFTRVSKRSPPTQPFTPVSVDQALPPQAEPPMPPAPPVKEAGAPGSPTRDAGTPGPAAEQPWQPGQESPYRGSVHSQANPFPPASISPVHDLAAAQPAAGQPEWQATSASPYRNSIQSQAAPAVGQQYSPSPASPARGPVLAPPPAGGQPWFSPAPAAAQAPPPSTLSPAQGAGNLPVEDRLAAALRGLKVAQGEAPPAPEPAPSRAPDVAAAAAHAAPPPAADAHSPQPNPFAQQQTRPLFTPPVQSQQPAPAQPPVQLSSQPSAAAQYMRDYQRQSGMQPNSGTSGLNENAPSATPAETAAAAAVTAPAPAPAPATASAPAPGPAPAQTYAPPPAVAQVPPGPTQQYWQQPVEPVAPQPAAQSSQPWHWQQPAEQPVQQQQATSSAHPQLAEAPSAPAASATAEAPLTGKLTDGGLPVQFFVKALYDYQSTTPFEMDMEAGDIIAVTEYPPDGWWKGELLDENRRRPGANTFPSNFVELLV